MMQRILAMSGVAMMVITLAGLIGQAQGRSMQGKAPVTVVKPVKASPAAQVNLNTASAADLRTLPNIGAATAARIIEYRQKNGGFKKIEDLMNVKGIGEKSFLKLKPLVTVAAAKTGDR